MANIKAWGAAFHGLVTNGILALPNGDTMEYPQPADGSVSLIDLPKKGMNKLMPDDVSALADQGKEFRDYALLSGGNQIYGANIGGDYIYQSPDGRNWLVDVSDLDIPGNILSNGVSGDIVLTEFGKFVTNKAIQAETHTVSVSISNIGQSAPVIPTDEYGFDVTNGTLDFVSSSPDGSKAAFSIFAYTSAPYSIRSSGISGFLELGLSGNAPDFGASVYVLRTRSQTLGVVEVVSPSTPEDYWQSCWGTQDGPSWFLPSAGESCDGYSGIGFVGMNADVVYSDSVVGRIFSMLYDESGSAVECVANITATTALNSTYTISGPVASKSVSQVADILYEINIGPMSKSISGTATKNYSQTVTLESSLVNYTTSETYSASSDLDGDTASSSNAVYAGVLSRHYVDTTLLGLRVLSFGGVKMVTSGSTGTEIESVSVSPVQAVMNSSIYTFYKRKLYKDGSAVDWHKHGITLKAVQSSAVNAIGKYATQHPVDGTLIWASDVPVCYV